MEGQNLEGKILVVDDEDMVREIVGEYLKDDGHEVAIASNGIEALNIYKAGGIKLVLSDMTMPGMDGYELYGKIKEVDPKAKFCVMSGYCDADELQDMKDKGIDGFIKKPFRRDDILGCISSALQG